MEKEHIERKEQDIKGTDPLQTVRCTQKQRGIIL